MNVHPPDPLPPMPEDPPPIIGLNSHRSRIEHKLNETRYFYERLLAKYIRYKKLVKQKAWNGDRARGEVQEWMYCASAFISATRSTYYYLLRSTKAKSDDRGWLLKQEQLPIHEIGKQLRDFMLHEATPNTGFQVDLPPPKPGESKGDWVVRGLMHEPRNAVIAISVAEVLPQLKPEAIALAQGFKDDGTELLAAILKGVEQLVSDAEARGMLTDDGIGPGISTKRTR